MYILNIPSMFSYQDIFYLSKYFSPNLSVTYYEFDVLEIIAAIVWIFMSPQNEYVEILTPNVIVLGGGGLWFIIRSGGQSPHEWG